jgi:hypothetical protein
VGWRRTPTLDGLKWLARVTRPEGQLALAGSAPAVEGTLAPVQPAQLAVAESPGDSGEGGEGSFSFWSSFSSDENEDENEKGPGGHVTPSA